MDGGRQYGVEGVIWVEEKDGTEGQRSEVILRGGCDREIYRGQERERGDNSKQQAHERCFCPW